MEKEKLIQNLYTLISSLKTPEDCEMLFSDMCTVKEIEQMADRVYGAQLLLEGKTYQQVMEMCDISSATL